MKSVNPIFLAVTAVCLWCFAPILGNVQGTQQAAHSQQGQATPTGGKAASGSQKSSGQAAKQPADKQAYAKEAFVIEKYVTRLRFENDGTGERVLQVRVRAQSAAGAEQLKTLVFAYNAKREAVNVAHVRVIQKDGTAKNLGAEWVKDAPAALCKDAPAYADYREKQVSVDGMQEGATLDYEMTTKINSAFIPGEFFYEHNFVDAAVVLDEQLEVNLPAGREATIRGTKVADSKREANGRVICLWKHSNLPPAKDASSPPGGSGDANEDGGKEGLATRQAVEITSFKSWEQIGHWYSQFLTADAGKNAEIGSKAADITKDCKTEQEKIAGLYTFVAQHIRYVSLPFGEGLDQPLNPADILKNGYGDSQDKHFLLAAMLDAVGVKAQPALISSTRKLNEQAPSPGQFDHLITTIPKDPEGKQIWLDSTADVAPFEYLLPNLRGKNAVVVAANGEARIERAPENPPFPSTEVVNVEARLSELGKLTAKVNYELRGDNEFAFRSAFHRTPESGWNRIGQTVAVLDGLQGQISNVHAADPMDTTKAFAFDFELAQKRAADWSQKKSTISVPLPSLGMPPAPEKDVKVDFGTPLDVTLNLKLEYPETDTLAAPVGVTVMRDYAEYRSSYKVEGHALQVQRTVRFKMSELAADRAEDYRAFTRAALADQNQAISIGRTPKDANAVASSAKAEELVEAGDAALGAGNTHAAIDLVRRAIRQEPSRKDVRNNLGLAYLRLGQVDPAINAFQEQIRLNAKDSIAHDYLGAAYLQQHKDTEAVEAFRKQLEINPLDKFAHASLGVLYFQQEKFSEAQPELEKAAILNPDNAQIEITLGKCYLKLGKTADARTAFDKAAQISPTGEILNAIAYEMAENNLDLEKAQQYAVAAVKELSETLRDVDFDHLSVKDLADVQDLGAFWDTLGVIYFRLGDLDEGAIYLRCAWKLTQNPTTAKHLAEVYEKQGQKDLAAELGAAGAAEGDAGGKAGSGGPGSSAIAARVFAVPVIQGVTGNADFFILLSPAEKGAKPATTVEQVKFVSGVAGLKSAADELRAIDFGEMIPPGSAAKIVRRGSVKCSASECRFVLALPRDVKSVD